MPSTGVRDLDEIMKGDGYPDGSAILVTGPPGIGKEALGYWFIQSGLERGEFCVYVTRLSLHDVQRDQKAFGIVASSRSPIWFAKDGGQVTLDISDLGRLLGEIGRVLDKGGNGKTRIVVDILSSVLVLNPPETAYRFVDGLIEEVKRHNAVMLATLEEGMHPIQTEVAMQQLFDGWVEFVFHRAGLRLDSVLRIAKMSGRTPQHDYYGFSFANSGMRLRQAREVLDTGSLSGPSLVSSPESLSAPLLTGVGTQTAFDFLVKSFVDDYVTNKFAVEQSGWRTRGAVAEATGVARDSFYGKEGRFGPILKGLLSSGLVETRFFTGERGRGGEVVKLRIAYEKELVKRIVDAKVHKGGGSVR